MNRTNENTDTVRALSFKIDGKHTAQLDGVAKSLGFRILSRRTIDGSNAARWVSREYIVDSLDFAELALALTHLAPRYRAALRSWKGGTIRRTGARQWSAGKWARVAQRIELDVAA